VLDSWVGYTGGNTADGAPPPSYASVCGGDGHTEALKLKLDPRVLSYEAFLQTWLDDARVPCYPRPGEKAQYRTAVFARDARQAAAARRLVAESGKEVPVLVTREWFDAEGWHQHFYRDAKDFPEDDELEEEDDYVHWQLAARV